MIKRKKSMTSFDVAAVASELRAYLGSRIVNVYALPGPSGLLLKLKGSQGDARLVIVPGEKAHLTRYDVAEKGFPPPLVMGIRKHVRGSRLTSVEQHGFDRILVLGFGTRSGEWRLVAELLPRGVVALLSSDGRIVQVTEQKEMRDRVLRRGLPYQPPPGASIHPRQLTVEHVRAALGGKGEAARLLARGLGYPGEAVEEALLRCGLDPSIPGGEAAEAAECIVETLRSLYEEALKGSGYLIYPREGGAALTVVPFEPRGLSGKYEFRVERLESISEALDKFFVEEVKRTEEEAAVREVEAERRRLMASLERARKNLEELREKAARLEKYMELIGENIGLVYEAVECARRMREKAGWDYIVGNCPSVVDVNPSQGIIILSIEGISIPVDVRVDPSRLLVELSRKAGELRAKIERGKRSLAEIEEKLRRLSEQVERRAVRARALVRRREWYEKYHWLVSSHGFLAIGGRDASQNESVVKRYLNEKRIFMHADIHGAPAVVVFAEGVEPPEGDLREAALLTAAYSKAWKGGVGSVDVYWVWGSQVSKSPPPGEYLARGAFMVYGKRNYIRNVELRLGIGVGEENGAPVVIVGPPDLVARRSIVYAVLVPGDEDPSKLAARLRRLFRAKAGEKAPLVEAVKSEEIRLRIPGRARAIYVGRGEARERPRPIREVRGEEAGETTDSSP